jgi:hypothetical protein
MSAPHFQKTLFARTSPSKDSTRQNVESSKKIDESDKKLKEQGNPAHTFDRK